MRTLLRFLLIVVLVICRSTEMLYGQTLSSVAVPTYVNSVASTYGDIIPALTAETVIRNIVTDVDPYSGKQVYVWGEADGSGTRDIWCAIYDKDQYLLTGPFRVNTTTTADQSMQRVRINPNDGSFVVAWGSMQTGDWNVYAKKISLNLLQANISTVTAQTDFLVNQTTAGNQQSPIPVFCGASGELLIGFTGYPVSSSSGTAYYQRINYTNSATAGTAALQLAVSGLADQQLNASTSIVSHILNSMEYSSYSSQVITTYTSTTSAGVVYVTRRDITYSTSAGYTYDAELYVNTVGTGNNESSNITINQTTGNYAIASESTYGGWNIYFSVFNAANTQVTTQTYASPGANPSENIINPRGVWDERTNVLFFFWDIYTGAGTNIWCSMFDGNNSFNPLGAAAVPYNAQSTTASPPSAFLPAGTPAPPAPANTNGDWGGYYFPVYHAASHTIYLAYDLLNSGSTASVAHVTKLSYSHPTFNPALSTWNTTANTGTGIMNWVDTKQFNAYGDVIGEARVYYDQFGKQVQTQALNQDKNLILAQMPLYDNLDRPAIQTLSAALTSNGGLLSNSGTSSFQYDPLFAAQNSTPRNAYLPSMWDASNTTTTPLSIANNYGIGEYYSSNNVIETGVGQTGFPYSRMKYSDSVPGGVVMQTLPGDAHHLGSGHESRSISLGVLNELNHYAGVRTANFMTATPCTTLKQQATKTISTDPNGITSIVFTDRAGHTIATAKEGSQAQNTPVVAQTVDLMPNVYSLNLTISNTTNVIQYFQLFASDSIQVFDQATGNMLYPFYVNGGSLTTPFPKGLASGFDITQIPTQYPAVTGIQIRSNGDFNIRYLWHCLVMTSCSDTWMTVPAVYNTGQKGIDLHLQTGHALSLSCGTAYTNIQVMNLTTGALVYKGTVSGFSSSSLAIGYYRFIYGDMPYNSVYTSTTTQNIHITFNQYYQNFAYFFYDDAGRLKAKTAPLGVNVASTALPGYTDTYTYSTVGQLLSMTEVDAGTTNYVYKKDGQLRFSQNAQQASTGTFSFTQYDQYNRVSLSGEYNPALGTSPLVFQTLIAYINSGSPTVTTSVCGILESTTTNNPAAIPSNVYAFYDEYSQVNQSELNTLSILNGSGTVITTLPNGTTRTQRNTWNRVSSTGNKWGYTTAYSYDNEGRVEWMIEYLSGLGSKTIDYVYDQSGNLLQTIYQQNSGTERFEHVYKYDNLGRMKTAWTREFTGMLKLHEKYYYYAHGLLKRKELAGNLQGIDYVYTVQGWLKGINNSTLNAAQDPGQDGNTGSANAGFCKDAFGMSMDYYNGDYSNSSITYFTPGAMIAYGLSGSTIPAAVLSNLQGNLYNGSIRSISWLNGTSAAGSNPNQYAYNYDYKYQLTQATFGASVFEAGPYIFTSNSNSLYTMSTAYDLNGNLTDKATNKTAGIENMVYAYTANTNKLSGLQIYSNAPTPATRSYSYDNIGEMSNQTDGTAQKNVSYNVYGLVVNVKDANQNVIVAYEYNERGKRAKKYSYTIVNNVSSLAYTTWYVTDAAGNELSIYSTNQSTTTTPTPLQTEIAVYGQSRAGIYNLSYSSTTTGGVTTYALSGTAFNYEIKDHLGSVRVIINRNLNTNSTVNIMSWADYLPFGEVMQSSPVTGYNDRYGYQGEYAICDPETATNTGGNNIGGWNSFDHRMFDANLGRWLSPDAGKQYHSPYEGMGNDPVNGVDPDGNAWGLLIDGNGNKLYKWFGEGVDVSGPYKHVSDNFSYYNDNKSVQHDETATFEFAPGTLDGMKFVVNTSHSSIKALPEATIIYDYFDGSGNIQSTTFMRGKAFVIGAGNSTGIPVDAVYAPHIDANSVFKVSNGNSVTVTDNNIEVHYGGGTSWVAQNIPTPWTDTGGWKTGDEIDSSFKELMPLELR